MYGFCIILAFVVRMKLSDLDIRNDLVAILLPSNPYPVPNLFAAFTHVINSEALTRNFKDYAFVLAEFQRFISMCSDIADHLFIILQFFAQLFSHQTMSDVVMFFVVRFLFVRHKFKEDEIQSLIQYDPSNKK